MAIVLYPDLSNPDLVFPTMMFDLLPIGIRGLVFTGFIAAIMSSIDSTLNSASTLVTMDFVHKFKPGLDRVQLMRVGRVATFIFMVLAAAWAPQIENFGSLFKYLQSVLAYISPPIVAVFLLGLFWKRTNATGAFASLLTGLAFAIFLLVFQRAPWMPNIHFLYVAPLLLIISGLTAVIVSLAGDPPPREKVDDYTWTPSLFAREGRELAGLPWYANYRILSVLVLLFTAGTVALFW
jgi:SSS family solute:Na+ symporter